MEHLTKQQIVLLTLFTSFVTSIATGIVTVALMDQAPVGVTGTIDHVIERTIEQVAPSSDADQTAAAASAVVDPQTQITDSLATIQKSIVTIENVTGTDASGALVGSTTGIGLVVSSKGAIITDKAAIALVGSYIAVLPNGKIIPVQVALSQESGDLAVLTVSGLPNGSGSAGAAVTFTPAPLADAIPKLGQTVLSLSGADSPTLLQGIITTASTSFATSIDLSKASTASVIFTPDGHVVGLQTLSGAYYPASVIRSALSAV